MVTKARISEGLGDLLAYLADTRAAQVGLTASEAASIWDTLRAKFYHDLDWRMWRLIIDAEQHLLHVGAVHEPDYTRLLAEVRRLLIAEGYYRRRLLTDTEEAEFELNGDQWLWTGRTNREELDR